jgi:hypothetical protein
MYKLHEPGSCSCRDGRGRFCMALRRASDDFEFRYGTSC